MLRLKTSVVAGIVGVALLSGCGGGDDGDSYCDALQSWHGDLEAFTASDFSGFDRLVDQVQELRKDAPDEVADDWKVLDDKFQDFLDALKAADLTPADLVALGNGDRPDKEIDLDALQEANEKAAALRDEEFLAAAAAIDEHARSECNVDLDENSPGA